MPLARQTINGFTALEVHEITGLSLPMIEYLRRADFLHPGYAPASTRRKRRRGKVRYYSYRDLVAARLVEKLRASGVELHKLKSAIQRVARAAIWSEDQDPAERLSWLVSDGNDVYFRNEDGFFDSFRKDGQRAFAFIVNLQALEGEVRQLIPPAKREHFTMRNEKLRFASGGRD